MSAAIRKHIRESVLKTALLHQLKNGQRSPERTARNMEELLIKYSPAAAGLIHYTDLLALVKSSSPDECLDKIMRKLS